MIRYRRPKQDDEIIHRLIETELVPLSHLPAKVLNQVKKELPGRLGRGVTLVASPDYDSDPLGFVHFMLHGDLLYIDMLAVASSAKRKRWGNMLMDRAERFALSRGCQRSKVAVDIGNAAGLAFYEKLGYSVVRYSSQGMCYEMEKRFLAMGI
ncbi:GNAT family N-acetyltransferase [Paenibacillus rhizophilus]|uniref:GNAT family N-acetyltransferase n=1 Tax=Paenibacillus rhizophilus TaxID=1850366 RepID=A0A3N9P8K0_9BACL|nr:GNAT family N-acetyltransferase [Paenibacillus rhizophilus]RQW12119.1 GNAT family N-acetyltransferase [Paenibacillus rhizophilus]